MSAAPIEGPSSPYRTSPHTGPRNVTELRAALSAVSPADRELFERQLGGLGLDDADGYAALVREWRHRLVMRTRPEILAAIAGSTDRSARRWTSDEILGERRQ